MYFEFLKSFVVNDDQGKPFCQVTAELDIQHVKDKVLFVILERSILYEEYKVGDYMVFDNETEQRLRFAEYGPYQAKTFADKMKKAVEEAKKEQAEEAEKAKRPLIELPSFLKRKQ